MALYAAWMRPCGTSRRSGRICRCTSFWAARAVLRSLHCHADGKTVEETSNNVSRFLDLGWKHVRIQLGGYGSPGLGKTPDFRSAGFGLPKDDYQENQPYVKGTLKLFEHIRKVHGDDVELIHDMHERIEPIEAVNLVKALQQYRLF